MGSCANILISDNKTITNKVPEIEFYQLNKKTIEQINWTKG